MKRTIVDLRSGSLRRFFATVAIGFMVLIGAVFAPVGWQAEAARLTPEATQYEVNQPIDQHQMHPEQAVNNAGEAGNTAVNSLKEAADTVREKLNLDEPLPEGTRDFFRQIRGEDVDIEEPRPFGK